MVPLIVEVLPLVYVSTPCFHRVFSYVRHMSKLVAHHTKQHPSSDDQTSSTKETLEQHHPSLVLNRLSFQCRFCQSTTLSFLQMFKRSFGSKKTCIVDKSIQPLLPETTSTPSSMAGISSQIERLHRLHSTSLLHESTFATSCTSFHQVYHSISLTINRT